MPVRVIKRHSKVTTSLVDSCTELSEQLMELSDCSKRYLNVVLTDDREIGTLNSTYRGLNKPTNVLSFPFEEGADPAVSSLDLNELGDIVISIDTAQREASRYSQPLTVRLLWLITHGFLHLMGYDHERSEQDARLMSAEEKRLISQIICKRRKKMTGLAINVDHVATIRQARGISEPDPVTAAAICELAGAQGIVVHLREDRRHIQDRDVRLLRETVKTKLNLEMGANKKIIEIALQVKPDMVTLVPEKRKELTTEGGLNVVAQKKKLATTIKKMDKAGIPVSLFIDPDLSQVRASHEIGATFVEVHTGAYADATEARRRHREFDLISAAVYEAEDLGLRINAGHGLNYLNTAAIAALPPVEELSIGHAVIARSIFVGLDQAVREMLDIVAAGVLQ